jgi:hypothetical protein
MTTYNVHIYREMRLTYIDIKADTPEAAAAIASDKPTDAADNIDDCEGENLAAVVDVAGDEDYSQSVTIDFKVEQPRKATGELHAALTWLLDDLADAGEACNPETGEDYDSVAFARAALGKANSASITPAPAALLLGNASDSNAA